MPDDCARCGYPPHGVARKLWGHQFCEWCVRIMEGTAQDNEDEDTGERDCHLCRGTGIGQHGDPDTSRCVSCGGSGVSRG